MEAATTTTAEKLSAINESLVELSMTLGRIAARQNRMLVDLKKMTVALTLTPAATTTPTFRVRDGSSSRAADGQDFVTLSLLGESGRGCWCTRCECCLRFRHAHQVFDTWLGSQLPLQPGRGGVPI
jgi:hypothetical protein